MPFDFRQSDPAGNANTLTTVLLSMFCDFLVELYQPFGEIPSASFRLSPNSFAAFQCTGTNVLIICCLWESCRKNFSCFDFINGVSVQSVGKKQLNSTDKIINSQGIYNYPLT